MSTLKTGALRGTSGTADSIQLHASNQSVTFPGAVTVTGALTSSTTTIGGGNLKVFTTDTTVSDGTKDYAYTVGAGVEKVEIILGRIKTNANDRMEIRLGYGSTPTYIGSAYVGSAVDIPSSNNPSTWNDDDNHWQINFGRNTDDYAFFGQVFINNAGGNRWVMSSVLGGVGASGLFTTSQELNMGQTLSTVKISTESNAGFKEGTFRVVEYRVV